MSAVHLEATITARWPGGHCSRSLASAEELAIFAIDLLVRELGVSAAQSFVEQTLEHFTHLHYTPPAALPGGSANAITVQATAP